MHRSAIHDDRSFARFPVLAVLAATAVCYFVNPSDDSRDTPQAFRVRFTCDQPLTREVEQELLRKAAVRAGLSKMEVVASSVSGSEAELLAKIVTPRSNEDACGMATAFASYGVAAISEIPLNSTEQLCELYRVDALLADLNHGAAGQATSRQQLLADRARIVRGERPAPAVEIIPLALSAPTNELAMLPIAPLCLLAVLAAACLLLARRQKPATIETKLQAAHSATMPVEGTTVSLAA